MTTPLPSEPDADNGLVPYMSVLVDRLYGRLPEVYRTVDAANLDWPLKRYLGGALTTGADVDDTIRAIDGDRPVGPLVPEPWALAPDELERWRADRLTRASALGDPGQADASWLPWLAQLVGARLDPAASESERRDTIRYATSGWRGGTRAAIADAARTALTGTRYARVVAHMIPSGGGLAAGGTWDVVVVTRASETPDPNAVIGAILRKGVKPAGVVLRHAVYSATWDQVEAVYPTWDLIDAVTWDQLEEAGLVYRAVPGNLMTTNPSFETNVTGWSGATANSVPARVVGGLDGVGMCRVTVTAAGQGQLVSPTVAVTPGSHHVSYSIRPDQTRVCRHVVTFLNGGGTTVGTQAVELGSVTADLWLRAGTDTPVVAPAGTASLRLQVQVDGMAAGEYVDVDAFYVRRT